MSEYNSMAAMLKSKQGKKLEAKHNKAVEARAASKRSGGKLYGNYPFANLKTMMYSAS